MPYIEIDLINYQVYKIWLEFKSKQRHNKLTNITILVIENKMFVMEKNELQ